MVRRYIARCTIRQHYYPESGWGWVVVVTGVMVQILAAGIHGAVGVWLLLEGSKRYRQPPLNVGTICIRRRSHFLISIFGQSRSLNRSINIRVTRTYSCAPPLYKRTERPIRRCYRYYYYINFKINSITTLR